MTGPGDAQAAAVEDAGPAAPAGPADTTWVRVTAPMNTTLDEFAAMHGTTVRARDPANGSAHALRQLLRAGALDAKPRAVTISRAHNPLRHGNFAAMIPGDSAVETVITSGLFSTLNIYNTLLIGRLILTVRRHGTHPYPTFRARPLDPSPTSLPVR